MLVSTAGTASLFSLSKITLIIICLMCIHLTFCACLACELHSTGYIVYVHRTASLLYTGDFVLASFLFVMFLAGPELIFFTVASVELCFGFVLETELIIQGYFHYQWAMLTQHQGLFCLSPHPISNRAGRALGDGTGHSQDSWPQLTPGTP